MDKSNLRALIKKGKLGEAIESLLVLDLEGRQRDEILVFSFRLKRSEEKVREGIISNENAIIQEVKITRDLLSFVGAIPEGSLVNPAIQEKEIKISDSKTSKLKEFSQNVTFWIKPIGVAEDPVPAGRKFETLIDARRFAKKPSIKIDDILICYGVGARQILSIYRVVELPQHESSEGIEKEPWKKRWPWYVIGENLTPNFGGSWWLHNLSPFNLARDFKEKYPAIPITKVGGNTLGGINRGHDKLKLRREFAEFLIGKVAATNEE